MSTIVANKAQIGQNATNANNFQLRTLNDAIFRITRGAAGSEIGDLLTITSAGKLTLPAMLASIGVNGYLELPNGLLLQWGAGTATTSGLAVTFPIAFPNNCRIFLPGSVNGVGAITVSANAPTTTGTTVYSASGSAGFHWIALGS